MRILFILFAISMLWAEGSVDVTVDRRRINEGESITLSVVAKNFNGKPDVTLSSFSDFKILNGPNQSSSTNVQFINGNMEKSKTVTLSWTLIPHKVGHLKIPTFKIIIDGITFTSKPITIMVSDRKKLNSSNISKFFIDAKIDNSSPYRGEQITLVYTLYTQVDVTSFDEELPKYKGFWSEEIFSPKSLNLQEVSKNGVGYYAATIKKIALFPTKSGKIEIDPMIAMIGIREHQQRWNDFSLFGPPSKKFTISTNSITLNVKPLPLNSKGEVSAIVGDWKIKSKVDSNELKQDQAITFEVEIYGVGNIQVVDLLDIPFPNELEVFEPEIIVHSNSLGDKIGGEKKIEWVLIPRFAGKIHIPKLTLNYFDPVLEKWVSKSTIDYYLDVSPSEKITSTSMGLSKEEIVLMAQDIHFLDESRPKWKNENDRLISNVSIFLILLSGVFFITPGVVDYSKSKRGLNNTNKRARRALKLALQSLIIGDMEKDEKYVQIYNAIIIFLNEKMSTMKVEYSNDEIIYLFEKHGAEKICAELKQILKIIEVGRFAPLSSEEKNIDVRNVKKILKVADSVWC